MRVCESVYCVRVRIRVRVVRCTRFGLPGIRTLETDTIIGGHVVIVAALAGVTIDRDEGHRQLRQAWLLDGLCNKT